MATIGRKHKCRYCPATEGLVFIAAHEDIWVCGKCYREHWQELSILEAEYTDDAGGGEDIDTWLSKHGIR